MSRATAVVAVEAVVGLGALVAAVLLGVAGVSAGGGPNALPDGAMLDTPVYHGPWIVSSFVLAAAAALLLIDAAVRARRRRTDRSSAR